MYVVSKFSERIWLIQCIVVVVIISAYSARTVESPPNIHAWWIFSTDQPVECCCPCGAGWSISYWDDLGDASSLVWGDDRVTDRYGTRALDGLACLRRAWQCGQRQNSSGVWWDLTLGRDRLMSNVVDKCIVVAAVCALFSCTEVYVVCGVCM